MSRRKTVKISFWTHDPLSFGQGVVTQRQTKLKLAYAINRAIKNRKLQRAVAANMLNLAPRKVANLKSYSLSDFSIEELAGFLTVLNRSEKVNLLHLHG